MLLLVGAGCKGTLLSAAQAGALYGALTPVQTKFYCYDNTSKEIVVHPNASGVYGLTSYQVLLFYAALPRCDNPNGRKAVFNYTTKQYRYNGSQVKAPEELITLMAEAVQQNKLFENLERQVQTRATDAREDYVERVRQVVRAICRIAPGWDLDVLQYAANYTAQPEGFPDAIATAVANKSAEVCYICYWLLKAQFGVEYTKLYTKSGVIDGLATLNAEQSRLAAIDSTGDMRRLFDALRHEYKVVSSNIVIQEDLPTQSLISPRELKGTYEERQNFVQSLQPAFIYEYKAGPCVSLSFDDAVARDGQLYAIGDERLLSADDALLFVYSEKVYERIKCNKGNSQPPTVTPTSVSLNDGYLTIKAPLFNKQVEFRTPQCPRAASYRHEYMLHGVPIAMDVDLKQHVSSLCGLTASYSLAHGRYLLVSDFKPLSTGQPVVVTVVDESTGRKARFSVPRDNAVNTINIGFDVASGVTVFEQVGSNYVNTVSIDGGSMQGPTVTDTVDVSFSSDVEKTFTLGGIDAHDEPAWTTSDPQVFGAAAMLAASAALFAASVGLLAVRRSRRAA